MSFWSWFRGEPAVLEQKKKATPEQQAWSQRMRDLREKRRKIAFDLEAKRAEVTEAALRREEELDQIKHDAKVASYAFEKAKAEANIEDLNLDDADKDDDDKEQPDEDPVNGMVQLALGKFIEKFASSAGQDRGAARMDPAEAREVKAIAPTTKKKK